MTTLLIDDDPFALKLLSYQLKQLGCDDLVLCEHAQEALQLLATDAHLIDLVFCDLQMPEIDGVQFVRHLSTLGYRGSLVMLSAEDARILQTVLKLAQAHDIHMLGAVSKPVSIERLRQLLDSHAVAHDLRPQQTPADLGLAIANGQLVNYYQPKVSFSTGELVGVEALVRWQHPQDGLVQPDQFIAVAEEHLLIDALTRNVLYAALRQTQQWHAVGLDLQVSVNVSMDNLAVLDFPDMVAQMAREAGVALPLLVLEVTESRLMPDVRIPLDILTRLRLKRIGLSIDDFGTGHSSLAQLRDIPFDELKLDRSFVHGAAADPARVAILEGTLAMARHLGIKTVAEGVEDRADWDFLQSLGCNMAQGYFVARPMPGGDLPAWHAAWQPRCKALLARPA